GPMCVVKDFVEGIAETDVKAACMLYRAILGYTPAPEMAYKLFKHLQTYILRMRKQTLNAIFIAEWLAEHKKVSKVYYPTLLTGEEARLYRRQMSGPSAMIAFELKDCTKEAAFRFLKALNVILRAVSLGFVRSLAEHANTMTHSDIPPEDQLKMGITPGLIRLSIGLEEPEDIIEDLKRALAEV
ncbi:PLP-dependent transferase, partial [Candidatus Falkowbacteria bacterium]|nr:PLP-dependent transferase [Candidatus Falkowbacteria bacterium]